MSGSDGATSIVSRAQLIKSSRDWSSLERVALAVSTATESHTELYVERSGDRYRWSLIHPGGPCPLLRITAKFLEVDYTSIYVGCRVVGDRYSALDPGSPLSVVPDAWAILKLELRTPREDVEEAIRQSPELWESALES